MDVEDYIVKEWLATSGIDDEYKKDIRTTYDRVYKLFVNTSANRNLDNLFLSRDALNYCHAFNIPNTAIIHSAGADYQANNLWANVYNKTIQNAGLTDEERSFLYCLRYMLAVESMYSQIVDKICYLLVWRSNPPGTILGKNGHCCTKVDTVDIISRCSLATKCEFLAGNGFGDLADACDVKLRNATAHMTAIIGKPAVRSTHHRTATTSEVRNEAIIEGADIRIRRSSKDGAYKWEKVDMEKARRSLDMAIWMYDTVFKLCNTVHVYSTDREFLYALNHPDDPHYRITFSKGDVSVSRNENPSVPDQ